MSFKSIFYATFFSICLSCVPAYSANEDQLQYIGSYTNNMNRNAAELKALAFINKEQCELIGKLSDKLNDEFVQLRQKSGSGISKQEIKDIEQRFRNALSLVERCKRCFDEMNQALQSFNLCQDTDYFKKYITELNSKLVFYTQGLQKLAAGEFYNPDAERQENDVTRDLPIILRIIQTQRELELKDPSEKSRWNKLTQSAEKASLIQDYTAFANTAMKEFSQNTAFSSRLSEAYTLWYDILSSELDIMTDSEKYGTVKNTNSYKEYSELIRKKIDLKREQINILMDSNLKNNQLRDAIRNQNAKLLPIAKRLSELRMSLSSSAETGKKREDLLKQFTNKKPDFQKTPFFKKFQDIMARIDANNMDMAKSTNSGRPYSEELQVQKRLLFAELDLLSKEIDMSIFFEISTKKIEKLNAADRIRAKNMLEIIRDDASRLNKLKMEYQDLEAQIQILSQKKDRIENELYKKEDIYSDKMMNFSNELDEMLNSDNMRN